MTTQTCRRRLRHLLLFACAAVFLAPGLARATFYSWQPAGGNDGGFFDDPPHWTPTGPPSGFSDVASVTYVPGSAYSITVRNNTTSIGTLTLDSPNVDFLIPGFQ